MTTDSASNDDGNFPSVPVAFTVCDAPSANWVIRKIVEARAYAERVEQWAALEIRRSERDERFLLERFGRDLEQWAREQIAELRGRKSIALPAGTVGFRKVPSKLQVHDEQALIAWCKANLPQAVATVEHLLKSTVNDHVATTGELPHGTELAQGGEKFFIK